MTSTQLPPSPTRARPRDLSRFAGIAFAAFFVPAFVLLVTGPNIYEGGTLEEYAAAHVDGDRTLPLALVAYVLLPLAAACLVWAVAHMSRCLERDGGAPSLGGRVATMGATAMAVGLTVAGATSGAATVVSGGSGDGFPPDPATGYGLDMMAGHLLNVTLWGGALVLLGIGIAAWRARLIPAWLAWTGFVMAPLLPVAWVLGMLPLLVFLLWLAAVAVMLSPGRAATA